ERRQQRDERQAARVDGGKTDGEGRLQPDQAGRRLRELHHLALRRVRCMVGRDGVDAAVGNATQQRQRVLATGERRVYAARAIEGAPRVERPAEWVTRQATRIFPAERT